MKKVKYMNEHKSISESKKPSSTGSLLYSVNNALRVLKCFTKEEPSHRVTEISHQLGLNKS